MNMIDLRRLYGLHHVFICITIVYTCNTPGLFAGSAVIHSACLTKTPLSKVSAYSLIAASQFPYSCSHTTAFTAFTTAKGLVFQCIGQGQQII